MRPNGSYRTCPSCGKSHYRPRGLDRVQYCSPACYWKGRWGEKRTEVRVCVVCETQFLTFRSNNRIVCSRKCDSARKSATQSGSNSPLWRGGKTMPYVGAWKRQRRLARERDGGICLTCGSTNRPQIHHVIPARYGGTHDLSNLVTLCRSCHSREELKVNALYRGTLFPSQRRSDRQS